MIAVFKTSAVMVWLYTKHSAPIIATAAAYRQFVLVFGLKRRPGFRIGLATSSSFFTPTQKIFSKCLSRV